MTDVYLFCLGLGFVFTVGGAILGQFGGGDGGHGDAGGDVGGGYEAGHDAAAGNDGHGDAHGTEGGSLHLPLLSPTVISSYLAAFGGSGLLYERLLGPGKVWVHAPLAAGTAFVIGLGLAFGIYKLTTAFDSNRVARLSDAFAAPAEVTVSVPETGLGEVAYVSGGSRQTLSARSADGRRYKQGEQVRILSVDGGTAQVSAVLPPLSEATGAEDEKRIPAGEPVRERK